MHGITPPLLYKTLFPDANTEEMELPHWETYTYENQKDQKEINRWLEDRKAQSKTKKYLCEIIGLFYEAKTQNPDFKEAVKEYENNLLQENLQKYNKIICKFIPSINSNALKTTSGKIEAEPKTGGDNGGETKNDFSVKNGQVFYSGKDLKFPAGQIQDFFEQLVNKMGKTVTYTELEKITTLEKIRSYKSNASKILKEKSAPYEIATVTNEGYILRPTSES